MSYLEGDALEKSTAEKLMMFELVAVADPVRDEDGFQVGETVFGEVLGTVDAAYPGAVQAPAKAALLALGLAPSHFEDVDGATMAFRTSRGLVAVRVAS